MANNDWHYTLNGQQAAAPASPAHLKQLAASGQLQPTDLVWKEGMANWVPANSIKGLFGSSASVPPLKAPSPRQAEPEDVVPTEDDGRGGRPRAGGGGTFGTILMRIISINLSASPVTPAEKEQLSALGYPGDTAQRYLTWRRSFLFAVAAVTLVAAGLNTIKVLTFFDEKKVLVKPNGFGNLLEVLYLVSTYALPGGALAAALLWTKPELSWLILTASWLFAFVMPFVLILTPISWMFSIEAPKLPPGVPEDVVSLMAYQTKVRLAQFFGLDFFLPQMFPAALALGPGLARACLRLKSLVPGGILTGWILVVVAPLSALALVIPLAFAYPPVAGSILLILGAVLMLLAPLVYLVRAKLLTRPLTKYEVPGMNLLQWVSVGLTGIGVVLLVVFCLTLPGKQEDKGPPAGRGPGFGPPVAAPDQPSPKAVMTMLVIRLWIDAAGRSLFTGVLAADFLLGGMVLAWRNTQRYGKTQNGPLHEQALTELEPLAAPPAADKPAKRRKIEPGDYPPEDEE